MTLRAGCALLMMLIPGFAAADACPKLRALVAQSDAGFPDGDDVPIPPDARSCNLSRIDDGTQTYLCHWEFAYRDQNATVAFEALTHDISDCLSPLTILPADTGVNHPDTYHQRRYRIGSVVISAALKDKAALGQSLVFLRIDRAAK